MTDVINIKETLIAAIKASGEAGISPNGLAKQVGCTMTQLVIAVVGLGSAIATTDDGNLRAAPEKKKYAVDSKEDRAARKAAVQKGLAACLAKGEAFTVQDVLQSAHNEDEKVRYSDVIPVAEDALKAGNLKEKLAGRTRLWTAATPQA